MKQLFDYLDYRVYLREWIEERRMQGLPASNRWFAMKMGTGSTSWISAILKGGKGLSKTTANRLSLALRHSPEEIRYFETLVFFNQSTSNDERGAYYREIEAIRKSKNVRILGIDQYEYYSKWYYCAIRSLVGIGRFGPGDAALLAAKLRPAISPGRVRKALEQLVTWKLVVLDGDNMYRLTETAITAGNYSPAFAIDRFRQEAMRLAQEAIDRFPVPQREIAALTVGVSESTFTEIQTILQQTRLRIAQLANTDKAADRVYQLNLQFFPLSESITASKHSENEPVSTNGVKTK